VAWTLGVLVLLTGGSAFAAYRYDRATVGRILPGVEIGGVDLGGMTRAEAMRALGDAADQRLDRPIVVRAGDETWHVTPAELGASIDPAAKVDEALALSSEFSWPARVLRRLLDRPVNFTAELPVSHDPAQVDRFLKVVGQAVYVSPVDAAVDVRKGKLRLRHPEEGRELLAEESEQALLGALEAEGSAVDLTLETTEPKVSGKKLGHTLVVRLSKNKLYLYKGLNKKKVYRVATGSPGYPTPRGEWTIWHKAVNPTWINPAPNGWGAGMPRSIPGGPNGPLGTRALYLDAPGIRIHGTPNPGSIGTYASHGCIRMLMSDVEELYEIVDVDTQVLIID
jgi:lipoprotein-anchoring transpeptidase ErfK/SrfK